jgi:anthranilate synthase component 1
VPRIEIEPDYARFAAAYGRGEAQVLWTTLTADLETPVSAFLKLAADRVNAFLLESVEGGSTKVRGRYSCIGLEPDLIWRATGNRAEVNRAPGEDPAGFVPCPVGAKDGALASLRALVRESRMILPPALPPIAQGLFGYLGYDMVRLMERLPDANPDVLGIADALLLRPTVTAVFDNTKAELVLVAAVWPRRDLSAEAAFNRAARRLAEVSDRFEGQRSRCYDRAATGATPRYQPDPNMTPERYRAIVARAKDYIAAGDIFQVVLSQRFRLPFRLPPFALYRALRRLNPSPFLFYFAFDGFAVVGSSPEIMVQLRGNRVALRPIAGTRRRGADPAEDRALEADLLADPKERAEHLMLLDLGRNDVGRVARIGTVAVTQKMEVETYSDVMHIVSRVEGELRDGLDGIDVLIAGFPAGTVSGAPKIRAMEIIDELEPERRGLYAGCVGYFGGSGDVDTCIAIRTGIVKDGVLYVQAGGGIVADSDPAAEYQECVNKARALVRAAQDAERFA